MLDLNNIRYLIESAERGSFSGAARVFGVPPSLVSRKIARLEQDLGARLFQRTTRSLVLTDAGQAYLAHARDGLQALQRAQEALGTRDGAPSGRVRLTAPPGLSDVLRPLLARFLEENPAVRLELELADRQVDLVNERFDLAVRAGVDQRSDRLVGRRLLDAPRCLFASPDYLKRRGRPRTVVALEDHEGVFLGDRSDRASWKIHVGSRTQTVHVRGRIAVNQAGLAADFAAAGFGIAFLPRAVCAQHVADRRLVQILPRASGGETGLWLVYPDRQLAPASRALADHLVAGLAAPRISRPGRDEQAR